MEIYSFFFSKLFGRRATDFISKRLFDIVAEYYGKNAIPFPFPLGPRARLHFLASLAIRLGHVIEVGPMQYGRHDGTA